MAKDIAGLVSQQRDMELMKNAKELVLNQGQELGNKHNIESAQDGFVPNMSKTVKPYMFQLVETAASH